MPWINAPKKSAPTLLKAGVLGGGQLARMMIEDSSRAGIALHPFVGDSNEPAALVQPEHYLGELRPFLSEFSGPGAFVIFENEFVDVAAIKAEAKSLGSSAPQFYPALDTLGRLRDKLEQKKVLLKCGIPTAEFLEVENVGDADFDWSTLEDRLGADFILKWALFGYDGKGTFFFRAEAREEAARFARSAFQRGARVFAEKRVSFGYEVALVSVADRQFRCQHFPLVLSEQSQGICLRVRGPASALGIDAGLESRAQEAARSLASECGITGAFAIEFFVTNAPTPELLVNEIAPRVHNSGHFSQDAADPSQFLAHLLACAGKKVPQPRCKPFFAMLNLLGPEGVEYRRGPAALPTKLEPRHPRMSLHWYGKRDIKPGRKLGHWNVWAEDQNEFTESLALLELELNKVQTFLTHERGVTT